MIEPAKTEPYANKEQFANEFLRVYGADRQKVVSVWEARARERGIELERGDMTLVDYVWELRRQVRAATNTGN